MNYADDEMIYHMLDIYLPDAEKPAYPAVILIYGSAWFANNLKGTDHATLGKALLDAGFAVVAPNHRSSMDAKFPAQINDIKAVIRFVRGNSEKYQIDTSFIAQWLNLSVCSLAFSGIKMAKSFAEKQYENNKLLM